MKISLADKWFSIFIRLRDSDDNGICKCCTCGKYHSWKEMDCGHWIKRQHQATRFDERNCAAQCKACNYFEQGAEAKHELYIKNKYGEQATELLKAAKRTSFKRYKVEEKILMEMYKEKAKNLAKQKGIVL